MVVSDPRTGEILALVSTPSYDPNLFVDGISSKDYKALLGDENRPLLTVRCGHRIRQLPRLNLMWRSQRSAPA